MNTISPENIPEIDADALPTDINMVGGTMPGLMFYAGFMQQLFEVLEDLELASISGTSAGAFIAGMTVVGKHQDTPRILLDQFSNDTGIAGVGVFGKKTIQSNMSSIVSDHISIDDLENSKTQLKTLHMRIRKGVLMSGTENSPYKETFWFIQNLVKYFFEGTAYGSHEVFDSSKITDETRDRAMELLKGSFQYVPDNAYESGDLLTDGEMGSWHEGSGTAAELNKDIPKESNLLVLTRFPRGDTSHEAVVTQTAKFKNSTVVGPSEDLKGNKVSTNPEHMRHNLEVGKKTALLYLQVLSAE